MNAALPLHSGILLDPFMGSGSTVAAAMACGLDAIGVELNDDYFSLATKAIPALARLDIGPFSYGNGKQKAKPKLV